jgi:hypothetical protein
MQKNQLNFGQWIKRQTAFPPNDQNAKQSPYNVGFL